jgi:hypothetical protein
MSTIFVAELLESLHVSKPYAVTFAPLTIKDLYAGNLLASDALRRLVRLSFADNTNGFLYLIPLFSPHSLGFKDSNIIS